jgi:flagellar basal-body rod protein FlgG
MALTALFSAATGMKAQELAIDVVANNIANVNTTGFKKVRPNFQDLLYQQLHAAGGVDANDNREASETAIGLGVQLVSTQRDFTQGRLEATGAPLDVAIEGIGFFQVELPEDVGRGGYGFTRDGNFYRDGETGDIVTSQGYRLQPSISIPDDATDIIIAKDGTVSVTTPSQAEPQQVGNIELAFFVNEQGLEAIGDNLFIETGASGPVTTGTPGSGPLGLLNQNHLESSNVELVEELVRMIRTQRAFEFNSQSIKTADEMLQTVTNLRR